MYGQCPSNGLAASTMNNTGTITSVPTPGFPALLGTYGYPYYCLILNDTGAIHIASNELDLGGTVNLNSGATVTGPSLTTLGIIGTVTVNPGASINGPDTINGYGTLVLDTNVTAPTVHVSNLSGPGNLTVTADLNIATLAGPGTTTVAPGATFEVSYLNITGGTLVNQGTATAEASSNFYIGAGATFTNQGSITLDSSSTMYGQCP